MPDWEVRTEWKHGRHTLTPNTELSLTGVRGRVRFIRHVTSSTSSWIDVATARGVRSFAVDRIRTVHRRG